MDIRIYVAGKEKTDRLFNLYKVGTSKMWNGATVFWQIDVSRNVRAGKIMGNDYETGHRIKEPFTQVSWVHSVKKIQNFHMKQCLFGEHLLADDSSLARTVAIVESEKTAQVAALFIPDFIWLVTGGMHGCFNGEAMQVLRGREVVLFPDLKATDEYTAQSCIATTHQRIGTGIGEVIRSLASGVCKKVHKYNKDFLPDSNKVPSASGRIRIGVSKLKYQSFIKRTFIMKIDRKQTMHVEAGKSFSTAEANENERRWNEDKIDRKNQDPTNHYDKTRMKLNFEIGPDGKNHPWGYQEKPLEVRLQERLDE